MIAAQINTRGAPRGIPVSAVHCKLSMSIAFQWNHILLRLWHPLGQMHPLQNASRRLCSLEGGKKNPSWRLSPP